MLSPRTLPCIGLPISPFSGGILPLPPLILVRGFSDVHTREAIPLPISNREVKLSRAPVVLSWETRREVGVTSDSFPFSGGFFFFFAVGVGAGWYQVMRVMRVGGGPCRVHAPPLFCHSAAEGGGVPGGVVLAGLAKRSFVTRRGLFVRLYGGARSLRCAQSAPPFFVTWRRRAGEFLVALCWLVCHNAALVLFVRGGRVLCDVRRVRAPFFCHSAGKRGGVPGGRGALCFLVTRRQMAKRFLRHGDRLVTTTARFLSAGISPFHNWSTSKHTPSSPTSISRLQLRIPRSESKRSH